LPASTWRSYLYNDGTNIAIPCENVLKALSHAGKQIPRGRNSNYGKIVQSGLTPDTPFFHFTPTISLDQIEKAVGKIDELRDFGKHVDAVKPLGIRLWAKRASVQSSKHVRVRPRFDKWSCVVALTAITDDFDKDVLTRLFALAGVYSGLCDWRPSSPMAPGPYGKFTAALKF
jgi:hypothetical protein